MGIHHAAHSWNHRWQQHSMHHHNVISITLPTISVTRHVEEHCRRNSTDAQSVDLYRMQSIMTSGVLLKMEVGRRKGAWRRAWRYPAYLWSLRRLVYAVYPRIPPNTPLLMTEWYTLRQVIPKPDLALSTVVTSHKLHTSTLHSAWHINQTPEQTLISFKTMMAASLKLNVLYR